MAAWVAVNSWYTIREECTYIYSIAKQNGIYGILMEILIVNVGDRWEEQDKDIFKIPRA